MTDWGNEAEWRLVVYAKQADQELYLHFNDSLVGLVFGEETPDASVDAMMALTPSSVHLGLKWKNCSPWYDYANPRPKGGTSAYMRRRHRARR